MVPDGPTWSDQGTDRQGVLLSCSGQLKTNLHQGHLDGSVSNLESLQVCFMSCNNFCGQQTAAVMALWGPRSSSLRSGIVSSKENREVNIFHLSCCAKKSKLKSVLEKVCGFPPAFQKKVDNNT